jgi:hypothetical protein
MEEVQNEWTKAYNIERDVYNYWKVERPNLLHDMDHTIPDELNDKLNALADENDVSRFSIIFHDDFRDHHLVKEYCKGLDKSRKIEMKIARLDKTNLRKIISILDGLWD